MSTKKKKKYIKFRHKVFRKVLAPFVFLYVWFRFHHTVTPFKQEGKRPYFILYNHQTDGDQFLVALTFKQPIYYVASEDIFSMGWVSGLIKYLVAPIPFKKNTTDARSIMNCLTVAKEGGSIAISPEGNRTFSGKTGYIRPSIVKLCRALKMPIAIVHIEGGYGVQPRWSTTARRGKMKTYVYSVIEKEEYDALTDEQFLSLIKDKMWVDESGVGGRYVHKKKAEKLERAMYLCPRCGIGKWASKGNIVRCQCGIEVSYGEDKSLSANTSEFTYSCIGEWYDAQEAFIKSIDLNDYMTKPLQQGTVTLYAEEVYKRKYLLQKDCSFALYGDRFVFGDRTFYFADISSVAVQGRDKLMFVHKEEYYQLKGDEAFNVLLPLNTYYHSQKENQDEFLGL